jgi:EAL domain-containing protein (putative c-di-GMP-specific phosphodiesterase class I)
MGNQERYMPSWYLEGYFSIDGLVQRKFIDVSPFLIGRKENLSLSIAISSVSRLHAIISEEDGILSINDLGSSNGTFVNHLSISSPTKLAHGDVIHLGNVEMRLMHDQTQHEKVASDSTIMTPRDRLSNHFPTGVKELEELLIRKMVKPAFQSIVDHQNSSVFGYELLGRGAHPSLPVNPGGLFEIAESVGLDVQLSEMLREIGIQTAVENGLKGHVFMNTHPSEMANPDQLMQKIHWLKKKYPDCQMALEIHEQAIPNIDLIKHIKSELKKWDILLSYDDFGVGQSRLLELVEAAPDILKFDMMLVDNIHKAPQAKVELVQQLHDMARSLKIKTLAECLSQQEDYVLCQKVGFDFYQGYLFALPRFIEQIV